MHGRMANEGNAIDLPQSPIENVEKAPGSALLQHYNVLKADIQHANQDVLVEGVQTLTRLLVNM